MYYINFMAVMGKERIDISFEEKKIKEAKTLDI